jgi:hypothetical protein
MGTSETWPSEAAGCSDRDRAPQPPRHCPASDQQEGEMEQACGSDAHDASAHPWLGRTCGERGRPQQAPRRAPEAGWL